MLRTFTDDFLRDANNALLAGEHITSFSKRMHCSVGRLSTALEKAGLRPKCPPGPRTIFNPETLRSLYLKHLWSEQRLANCFKVQRSTIKRALELNGIQRRTASEASAVRMGRMTPAERAALITPARESRTANLKRDARYNLRNPAVGQGEYQLAEALRAAGLPVEVQRECDGYLIDIAVNNVAVEVKFRRRYKSLIGLHGIRFKHILESGYTLVHVLLQGDSASSEQMNKIVAYIKRASRFNPSFPSESPAAQASTWPPTVATTLSRGSCSTPGCRWSITGTAAGSASATGASR